MSPGMTTSVSSKSMRAGVTATSLSASSALLASRTV